MANNFFNDSNKAYSENLNDGILVGNAFDWTVDVSLPTDTGGVFPNSSTISMAKVADVYISPNSNLSIGSTISNSSGSSQVYRLTVYPNFNRYGGFKSISVTASSGVTFYVANKGASTPIANNLDYSDLSSVPELKVLKEYDIVLTIPNGKSVSGLEFVFQSSSASVSGSISQSNVTGLSDSLASKVSVSDIKDNLTSTATNVPLSAKQGKVLNDTKLNTSNLFNLVYPVGSIYMSVNSTSPQTLFGGTWEKIKDTFLLSSGDTYSNGATGGSADAVVVSHTHTQQSHSHTNTDGNFVTSDVASANNTRVDYSGSGNRMVDGIATTSSIFHHRPATSGTTAINNATGVDGTGKNMPPYLAVNVWKRTA